jgi:CHAD domain-containing protein
VLAHDPGTRLGEDPEDLHQLRVATRRLRAFLRAGRPLLDAEWAEALRAELAWLGGALGPVRDLDVLVEHLHSDATTLPPAEQKALEGLFAALDAERERDREAMIEAIRSERYLRLLDALESAAGAPMLVASDVTLAAVAAAEFRKLEKAVKALPPDPTDDELHGVRIRGKRARYAAELATPVVGKPALRFVERAKAFQDLVGAHQDAVVAEARIREVLGRARGARAGFAGGRLVERQRARRAAARASFPDAWAALRKAGRKAWT